MVINLIINYHYSVIQVTSANYYKICCLIEINLQAMELLTTQRGGIKCIFEDHIYTRKRENAGFIYWYCAKRDMNGCRGAMKSTITMESPSVRLFY